MHQCKEHWPLAFLQMHMEEVLSQRCPEPAALKKLHVMVKTQMVEWVFFNNYGNYHCNQQLHAWSGMQLVHKSLVVQQRC